MGSFMNYSYDYVVIPLHYYVMLYFRDSVMILIYIYTPLMIRVLYYLSWHVSNIVKFKWYKYTGRYSWYQSFGSRKP